MPFYYKAADYTGGKTDKTIPIQLQFVSTNNKKQFIFTKYLKCLRTKQTLIWHLGQNSAIQDRQGEIWNALSCWVKLSKRYKNKLIFKMLNAKGQIGLCRLACLTTQWLYAILQEPEVEMGWTRAYRSAWLGCQTPVTWWRIPI